MGEWKRIKLSEVLKEKTERTKCMCLNFLESDDEWCHCGLYRKVEE